MAERIDELQLLIGSDASKAIEQLGSLASALDTAASSTRKLAGATGFLSSFSAGLSRIANTNLDKAITNLQRLADLDLSKLKDKRINIDLQVNGADRVDRLQYATTQATKTILKDTDSIAKALGREYKMDTDNVAVTTELLKEFVKTVSTKGDTDDFMEGIASHIQHSANVATATLTNTQEKIKDFLDYVNNMYIDPKGGSSASKELWKQLGLERQLSEAGRGIDTVWQDPDFRKVAGEWVNLDLTDTEDQFRDLAAAVEYARMQKTQFIATEEAVEQIQGRVNKTLQDLAQGYRDNFEKRMAQSKNAIPLDLDIDQSRFESKIQDAITAATTNKTYHAKPIQFDLDTDQLKQNIQNTIASIDFNKLPQFADAFKKMSESISEMNQTSLKDTGISEFTNSIRRLLSTDTSKFDVKTLDGIAATVKDMSGIGDVSKSLNSFVSSIARLANAGEKTGQTAEGMKKLTPEIKTAVKTFIELGTIDSALTSFIASLSRLATAGKKTDETANGLSNLSQAVMEFLNALSGAPEINENIANTIQGLGNLAAAGASAGKAMNSVMNGGGSGGNGFAKTAVDTFIRSYANGLKGLLNIALKLGGQGAAALGSFMGKLNLLPTSANSIDRTALSFSNLLRAILPFYGIRGLFEWGKDALDAGSSIVELENVIDTSFGNLKKGYEDISGYIYKWAETTIDAFGVSQIAAERYAGRLMAMFNSSGFDITEGMRDSAAKMTTDLIERAGDIASFYDISVDEAMTKMQAGLAGMTRPLRSLGINMSVANMQAFALSRGITTAWKEMDQATQMALRYEYMLHATQYAQGDFARTSGRVIAPCYREVA